MLPFTDEAADVNDNTVVYEVGGIQNYNRHEFAIYQAPGTGAVEVFISFDGTNYEATPVMCTDRSAATGGAAMLASFTAIGNYYFEGVVSKFKIQNLGATTGAVTKVRGVHSAV